MKLKEVLNDVISEAASGKDMDKLVNFLRRVYDGKVSQQGMLGAGFNLRNPVANNEGKLAETLGTSLNINITEDDVKEALKEVGVKSASDLATRWNKTKGKEQRRTDDKSLEGSEGKKGF